jgi:dienelactone hydrolase
MLRGKMLGLAVLLWAAQPMSPVEFGQDALREAAGSRYSDIRLSVSPSKTKEAYRIRGANGKVAIVGSDPVGAMYGAFEFAERLRNSGAQAWSTQADGKPFLPERGLNLFLTLPWNYAKHDTDFDVAALTDPQRWWFHNDDYWKTLLDLMAKSRLNWLDIHGTWDISVTNAPNLYAYFVTSPSFPLVGVPQTVKAANLAQLNKIVAMAHVRGIRVSLMAYEAGMRIPQNPRPPYQETEPNAYKYTREVVEQMIRGVPGLDAIGFRIGESGKSESFFNCYGEAVKRSGRDIPLITRSWITRRQRVLPLARASKDFTVEIKYNGEQWGAPYPVAGGRMATWNSYSFEDYLSDAGDPRKNAKTWPGWPADGGGKWPGNPYKIVWQVRANGTHRIFPFYNPDWVRRSISAMKVGTASGYTIEGEDAYYPKSQEYYLANPKDKYVDWIHQRDEMYWMTWGRLGYDPTTPDTVFDAKVAGWFGSQGQQIADIWKEASTVVPLAYMAYALGPDHRDHAPELETGGDAFAFVDGNPFDPFVFKPAHEVTGFQAVGGRDGRVKVSQIGLQLAKISADIRRKAAVISASLIKPDEKGRYKELENAMLMLSALAQYYGGRFRAAEELASRDQATLPKLQSTLLDGQIVAVGQLSPWDFAGLRPDGIPFGIGDPRLEAWRGWHILADSTASDFYKPFTERLRMHTNTFHWDSELASINAEPVFIKSNVPQEVTAQEAVQPWTPTSKEIRLSWKRENGTIVASVPAKGLATASLLYKPLPSSTFFHKTSMTLDGDRYVAGIPNERCGACLAAEIESDKGMARIPSFLAGEKPYIVVPSQGGPTPEIYGNEEAMRYLDSKSISPARYGTLLIAPRASNFFRSFDKATRRKVLDPVRRGMKLVILQQDFLSNRYPLDFLPTPLTVELSPTPNLFDPGGALNLPKIETHDILWQRFAPSKGWDVEGNGAIAHMKYGTGEIWVVAGRLMQRKTDSASAKALATILEMNGREKPLVLIDPGTEGAVFSSALYPDLLNALNIPFVTLGELIAKEQGLNSVKPIAGPTLDDDVLGGKGREMADAFLKAQVERMSHRPTPTTSEFEAVRAARKKELFRMLGLDPMPPKTPLNARQTGVLLGNGYHIEKIVFESRPRFYVTAHVYVPDKPGPQRRPVIVNVNGHWAHKKDEDRIQFRCQFQALQGYIAIAIDSPGHSFEGNSLIERKAEGEHDDYALVEGGTNTTGYYVWDAIRGLDYMATRPDTDMDHVGITGASGGGLATLYTFAADDRYKAAVPVVYMSSLELAPDNGCLCNHVPGTCQIGDRSDVIAIQAPKPVYIMGAQNDGEFTPPAMRLTHDKMVATWGLFGKGSDALCQIYAGGHDYNKPMRESMVGFFNKFLKGEGDGSPVPEPNLKAIDSEDRSLLVLDPPLPGERTMRDLSQEYLANAPATISLDEVFRINGGVPEKAALKYRELGVGSRRQVILEPQPGLQIPGILVVPPGRIKAVNIVVDDSGKAESSQSVQAADGVAVLYLDTLGIGELSGVEMRYSVYMGASIPYLDGWQIVRAAEAMRRYSTNIHVIGHGPIASQAAMYAGLMDQSFAEVLGTDCLRTWSDVFKTGTSDYAVQPRAHLCGSLDNLRAMVKHGHWEFAK